MPSYREPSIFFAIAVGVAILGYLLPYHSPLGRDFWVNSFSFIAVAFGVAVALFTLNRWRGVHLSVWTWLGFIVVLFAQLAFLPIAHPDALIFPIICLSLVAFASSVAYQFTDKALLLKILFGFAIVMAMITFIIQVMQIYDYTIFWQSWVIVRNNALPTRLDGNFGQANHTGYGFVLGLCAVIYLLHQTFTNQAIQQKLTKYLLAYRALLVVLFAVFCAGLAFTQSRAGMLMMIGVIAVYFFAQPMRWRTKFGLTVIGWLFFDLYYLGASWLASYLLNAGGLGAVSRMAGGQGNRPALNERAMMMFGDNPLIGVGWNNYMKASVDYAQFFSWPEIADHSHNFITMISAEMGVVGLLCCVPIGWVLLRAVHFRHSAQSAIALAFVLASLLYASVEYPLWYFRYLVIFAMFVPLIEPRHLDLVKKPLKINNLFFLRFSGMLSFILALAGVFYAYQYLQLDYLNYNRFITHKNHQFTDSQIDYHRKPLFGFSAYNQRLLAMQVPLNANHLAEKKEIFADVLTNDTSQFNLLAYAQLLAFENKPDEAMKYIQASCIMVQDVSFCDNVDSDLAKLAKNNPQVFGNLYRNFVKWREQNPEKTGLNVKSEIFDN
ncbi:O-antigen ligase family protein [Faucicola boevrei]|uniref:O-antigen ligase family protein n=1 Tax=Faucicola boevrei TaxID=346665 RepID=UPI0003802281|nr:O-antigen ligase family protein [Moraxella boevrei]